MNTTSANSKQLDTRTADSKSIMLWNKFMKKIKQKNYYNVLKIKKKYKEKYYYLINENIDSKSLEQHFFGLHCRPSISMI